MKKRLAWSIASSASLVAALVAGGVLRERRRLRWRRRIFSSNPAAHGTNQTPGGRSSGALAGDHIVGQDGTCLGSHDRQVGAHPAPTDRDGKEGKLYGVAISPDGRR